MQGLDASVRFHVAREDALSAYGEDFLSLELPFTMSETTETTSFGLSEQV